MSTALVAPALFSLLPVLGFLAMLLYLDSYKLVPIAWLGAMLGAGIAAAAASYVVNAWLVQHLQQDFTVFTRYVAPPVEEALKGIVVVWLIRRQRIGFLIDAAIMGFAVGSGFALVENLYALWRLPDAGMTTWIVRGFGTAIMHGGATAAWALVSLEMVELHDDRSWRGVLPGFLIAVLLHSAFNHLNASAQYATLAVVVVVPTLLLVAYQRGENKLGDWLGRGFDADADLLALMRSGGLPDSPMGHYLADLKSRFAGPVVADLLCYLRLFTELALRAKGVLLMRENGFDAAIDDETRAKFAELSYLERSIGRTGMMTLTPLLPMRRKALRQLHLIGE